jgi:hypothetical protein
MNKKTAHTETELLAIFKQDGNDEKYFSKFLEYYKVSFNELFEDYKNWTDDDFDEGDSVQASALWCTNDYIQKYIKLIEKGHGEEWAHQLANSLEDGERAVYFVHSNLKTINPELAKKELLIHTKALGGDEYFEKHYLLLFEVQADPKGRIETAQNYSRIYKEKIANGKSEIYAHHYADLIADGDYHEIYCEEYAFAFDKTISANKSEEYAREFADKYASALVDIKRRFGISDDEEMIDFAIEKVNAYMKAWEYNNEHPLKDFKRFAEIYENEHLNAYFPDEIIKNKSLEEIDSLVLEKTLERFNK